MKHPATPSQRIRLAITTRPRTRDWARAALELAWLLPVVVLCGLVGDFLRPELEPDFRALLTLALIAIIMPALGEELLFRVLLLPRPEESGNAALATGTSVAAFVLWHPLQALILGADKVPVFLNPWFLLAVAALGLALVRVYRASGSIWPCVAIHWLVVVGWKAFFGGPPNPFA